MGVTELSNESKEVTVAEAGFSKGEQETPAELAEVWLSRELKGVQNEIERKEYGYKSAQTYTPRSAGSAPAEGPGSLDYSDWEISRMEWEQWPAERDDIIESYPDEIYDLTQRLGEVQSKLRSVEQGDLETINRYANAERQKRQVENEREGTEYEGAGEAYEQLQNLFYLSNSRKHAQKLKESPESMGWVVLDRGTIGGYSEHLDLSNDQGSEKGYKSQIRLSRPGSWAKAEGETDEISVHYSSMVKKLNGPYGGGEEDGSMFFFIRGDVVSSQSVKGKDGKEHRFTVNDFAKFRNALNEAEADLKETVKS